MHEQFQYHDFVAVFVVFTQEHEEFIVPAAHDDIPDEFPDDELVVVLVNAALDTQQ